MTGVGIALIGAGSIAEFHLGGLAAVPDAHVVVVASRTLAPARAVADRHSVPEVTTDWAAAMSRPDVSAVVVTTPDDTHEAIADAALRAGRHVLLQKPMAPTAEACRRILAAARASGHDVQVSFMHRHFEEVAAARRLIDAGAIGRVMSVRLRNATPGPDWGDWFFKRDRVGGGVVMQLGVHGIDLVCHLFGAIQAVSARTATLVGERRLRDGHVVAVENPDTALAVYEIASGPLVNHEMSMIETAGTDRFRMEIYGTAGTIWLRSERGTLAVARQGVDGWDVPAMPQVPMGQRLHQQWIDGIVGRTPPARTAADALHGILVAEAIARSAGHGGARTPVETV